MRSPETGNIHTFVGINTATYVDHRYKLTALVEKPVEPDEVDIHEARHAVAAETNGTAVHGMTDIPNPAHNSLGETHLSRLDLIAAAAPHALGSKGTGSDMQKVYMLSDNPSFIIAAARSTLTGKESEVMRVARSLKKRRTLVRSEILDAMSGEGEIFNAQVHVEDTVTGESQTIFTHTRNEKGVIFDREKLPLVI